MYALLNIYLVDRDIAILGWGYSNIFIHHTFLLTYIVNEYLPCSTYSSAVKRLK